MAATDIHPDLLKSARVLPKGPVRAVTLPLLRAVSSMRQGRPAPGVEVLTTSTGLQIRLHRPTEQAEPGPAMLWLHGGGYVLGTAAQDDSLCRRFAKHLGITVAAVEYGLAPKYRYPYAVEQSYRALGWLAELPSVDPSRLVIAGASAGGGLAAQLALLTRDRGEIVPAAQHLVYPMIDDRTGRQPGTANPGFRLWDARSNALGWTSYLGDADVDTAVPARRTDLAGLPPAWIGVGTLDLFHDEDLAYAQRLRDAGVPCQLDVVDGAFHGFDQIAPKVGVAREFFQTQCAWLRAQLALPGV